MTIIASNKKNRIFRVLFVIMSLFGTILFILNFQQTYSFPVPLFGVSMHLLGNALFSDEFVGYLSLFALLILIISVVSFLIKKSRIKLFLNVIFFLFCFVDIVILLILFFARDTVDLWCVLLSILIDIVYAGLGVMTIVNADKTEHKTGDA